MLITGTYISYYHYCHRRLWLFAKEIKMEHNSELVSEGKHIEETSFQQRSIKGVQVSIEGIKVDFFDMNNGVVYETKRSKSNIYCDIAQLKYYIAVLRRNLIKVNYGILEYPKARVKEKIMLSEKEEAEIFIWEEKIKEILSSENCPEGINNYKCKRCAYHDFCFVGN